MIDPNFQKILKSKIDHYGETEAAYEFASEEYARQLISADNIYERVTKLENRVSELERFKTRTVKGAP